MFGDKEREGGGASGRSVMKQRSQTACDVVREGHDGPTADCGHGQLVCQLREQHGVDGLEKLCVAAAATVERERAECALDCVTSCLGGLRWAELHAQQLKVGVSFHVDGDADVGAVAEHAVQRLGVGFVGHGERVCRHMRFLRVNELGGEPAEGRGEEELLPGQAEGSGDETAVVGEEDRVGGGEAVAPGARYPVPGTLERQQQWVECADEQEGPQSAALCNAQNGLDEDTCWGSGELAGSWEAGGMAEFSSTVSPKLSVTSLRMTHEGKPRSCSEKATANGGTRSKAR